MAICLRDLPDIKKGSTCRYVYELWRYVCLHYCYCWLKNIFEKSCGYIVVVIIKKIIFVMDFKNDIL